MTYKKYFNLKRCIKGTLHSKISDSEECKIPLYVSECPYVKPGEWRYQMISSWIYAVSPQLHVNHLTIKMMTDEMRWLCINANDSSTNYAWTFSMFLRTLVMAEQEGLEAVANSPLEITLIWSFETNQCMGGFGSTFGEGGSLNLAPA